MKRYFQILTFILYWNLSFGQSIGVTLQFGGEFRPNANVRLENGIIDSFLNVSFSPGLVQKNYIGVNFYEKDGSGFDITFGYDFVNQGLSGFSRLDSTGFGNQFIAERKFRTFDIYADRYFPLAKRNERLKILWGYGFNGYYHRSDIDNITVSNLFKIENINTGFIPRLLGKLTFETKLKRFLVEGIFGLNVFNISYNYSRNFNPMLTQRQQTNSILDFDLPRGASWRFGVVYLFSRKNKTDNN